MRDEPAIIVEALPAGYGDALLVTCPVPDGTWRLLVDAGPDEAWPPLAKRLEALPKDGAGRRWIDLAIVSHIDHDHIGGTRLLFGDATLGLAFGDVWFNARQPLGERGVAEGEALATVLGAPERALPWNLAFAGGSVSTPGDGAFVELPAHPGFPRLTLLSPTPKRLARLAPVWDAERERLRRRESNTVAEIERGSAFPDLAALAAGKPRKDQAPPNGSSIAILLEHRGASVLLAADAFPTVLGSALLGLAKHRKVVPPLAVDAFKLSHHGSRGNLMVELLGAVRAAHYIVSTDNTRFEHPDDETLARIVLHGGAAPTLCFNYATPRNLRWADKALQAQHGFATCFPKAAHEGLVLALRAGEQPAVSPAMPASSPKRARSSLRHAR
jgi:beta-lactamase superfamily II metal-dependent hydrolase